MTGTRYFSINTYPVWTMENAYFNEIDKISLFQKWCITFTLIAQMRVFSYILQAIIWQN